jgi:phenylpropionate dioxygenase-like ring-hydroxylating dioxygenase large terminal subunit
MIPNLWYAVLDSHEVKSNRLTGALRMGERLVFWRDAAGKPVCMRDLCPHRGVALSTGKLIGEHLQCPFHGFEFNSQGECTYVPANGRNGPIPKAMRVHTYPARDEHGFIWIWWGEWRDSLPEVPWFPSLGDDFSYGTIKDHWKTHYTRAIENQLDVMHLPFIHYNTIGRGNKTVVDGPISGWNKDDSDLLQVWFTNRVDDGAPARSAREIRQPTGPALVNFHLPNIWQLWTGEANRVFLAFAPIDDENTMMYARFYQKFVRIPGLKKLVNAIGSLGNLYIIRQDRWVVLTERPKITGLRIGEQLIPGDLPIILYRRRREELKKASM